MSAHRDRLAEAVAALKAVLAADLPSELRGRHEGALLEDLQLIGELVRLGDAVGVRTAGELARREADEAAIAMPHGWRTLPDLVAFTAGVPLSAAQQWCSVGAAVTSRTSLLGETLPPSRRHVGAALDEGALTVEAASIIARALHGLEEHSSVDERDLAEGFLVQEAQVLTVRQLGRLCTALRDRFDPDGIEPREELLRRRSGVRRIQRPDGSVRWIIDPDPESDGWLKSAVDAQTAPRREVRFGDPDDPAVDPATADDRTLGQRQLAALANMAKRSLADDHGEVAGLPVAMMVTVSHETLKTGTGAAFIAGVDTPISAATARRLACQADIIPVVLGGDSEVLDVGRAKRLSPEVSASPWRSVTAAARGPAAKPHPAGAKRHTPRTRGTPAGGRTSTKGRCCAPTTITASITTAGLWRYATGSRTSSLPRTWTRPGRHDGVAASASRKTSPAELT